MSVTKHHVRIKGVKDGLVFLLDDACPFDELMEELKDKMENTHQQILTGPAIQVQVKLGAREIGEEEREAIRELIGRQGNLQIKSIEVHTLDPPAKPAPPPVTVVRGVVRSGQTVRHEGDVLYLGDINPGGTILSTGDIYILGALRGTAHAGTEGDREAVIAASYMRPTQLRIADMISRPPDEWGFQEAHMEFAYLKDGKMEVDKIQMLHRVRPGAAGLGSVVPVEDQSERK